MEYRPNLTEPGVKYFVSHTLKECRRLKDRYQTIILNVSLFIFLISVVGSILYFKYKGRLKPSEIKRKNREKQEYIISKLQQISMVKQKQNNNLITDLPVWNNHPEVEILNRKIYN
jgi:hypothetical protein